MAQNMAGRERSLFPRGRHRLYFEAYHTDVKSGENILIKLFEHILPPCS